jgi:glycosyltransferase involved in cell wall biosynthesis
LLAQRDERMNILLVAPIPFFRERGTPIAVRILCETLCEAGHSVDLLTYHIGTDIEIPGARVIRIPNVPFVKDVPIGFSLKKVICDLFLSIKMMGMVGRKKYQVIHAVEEAVFPALLVRLFGRTKLVYDMDSSMPDQLMEKWRYLRVLGPVLLAFERLAVRRADCVMAVCDDLVDRARAADPKKYVVALQDVPLESEPGNGPTEDLRQTCNIEGLFVLYVGNLEHYQGIDVLLEGFAALQPSGQIELVIIGGNDTDIARYREKSRLLGIEESTHFLGLRPIGQLADYLEQASILVSPRLTGNNTPMKIYSYLASGRPIIATRISSHSQVLDSSCAVLVEPTAEDMRQGLERLAMDEALRKSLGAAAIELCESKYSLAEYKRKVVDAYSHLA